MRKFYLLCILISFQISSYSQDTLKMYFDKNYNKVDIANASIIRKIVKKNKHFIISEQKINGKEIFYGEYISINPMIEDGTFKYYNGYGTLTHVGRYNKGKLSGQWVYFTNNIIDTIDYSNVEAYKLYNDSCFINNYKTDDSIINVQSRLQKFIDNNIRIPAKYNYDIVKTEINLSVIVDSNGYIQCPVFINSKNLDFEYEILRALLLYKCDSTISYPIKLYLTAIFEPTFVILEKPATFNGGDINDFRKYIQDKVDILVKGSKSKEKIVIQFCVNSNGSVVDVKILRGQNSDIENIVKNLLIYSPKWKPGMQNGKSAKIQFIIPIII